MYKSWHCVRWATKAAIPRYRHMEPGRVVDQYPLGWKALACTEARGEAAWLTGCSQDFMLSNQD